MDLASKKCVPCEVGGEPLTQNEVQKLLTEITNAWKLNEAGHLVRQFKFKDFKAAMDFVNKIAVLAEQEGHHPDMQVQYNRVTIELWTHAVKGRPPVEAKPAARQGSGFGSARSSGGSSTESTAAKSDAAITNSDPVPPGSSQFRDLRVYSSEPMTSHMVSSEMHSHLSKIDDERVRGSASIGGLTENDFILASKINAL